MIMNETEVKCSAPAVCRDHVHSFLCFMGTFATDFAGRSSQAGRELNAR
jgi:hypothetical protein